MARILHIQTSPMQERSYSIRLAQVFLESYQAANPGDTIEKLGLWETELPPFDHISASGKYKIMRGLPHSEEEARAWRRVTEAVDQLKAADKVVLSTGMWNFSIPYRLKQYIDIVVQPALTFTYDMVTGYAGLVTGRPLQLILASGGEYPAGSAMAPFDFQIPYLEMIFKFIGFTDIRTLRVEGTLSPAAQDNLEKTKILAREAGQRF